VRLIALVSSGGETTVSGSVEIGDVGDPHASGGMSEWAGQWRRADVVILTALRLEYDAVLEVDAGSVQGSTWEQTTGPSGPPLYLHMAALAAVEGVAFDAGTLIDVILDHEQRFWQTEAAARRPNHGRRAAGAAARRSGDASRRDPQRGRRAGPLHTAGAAAAQP
jgi:hypothetical protein